MERRSARFVDHVILSEAKNLSPDVYAGRLAIPALVRFGFAWEREGSSDVCHVLRLGPHPALQTLQTPEPENPRGKTASEQRLSPFA